MRLTLFVLLSFSVLAAQELRAQSNHFQLPHEIAEQNPSFENPLDAMPIAEFKPVRGAICGRLIAKIPRPFLNRVESAWQQSSYFNPATGVAEAPVEYEIEPSVLEENNWDATPMIRGIHGPNSDRFRVIHFAPVQYKSEPESVIDSMPQTEISNLPEQLPDLIDDEIRQPGIHVLTEYSDRVRKALNRSTNVPQQVKAVSSQFASVKPNIAAAFQYELSGLSSAAETNVNELMPLVDRARPRHLLEASPSPPKAFDEPVSFAGFNSRANRDPLRLVSAETVDEWNSINRMIEGVNLTSKQMLAEKKTPEKPLVPQRLRIREREDFQMNLGTPDSLPRFSDKTHTGSPLSQRQNEELPSLVPETGSGN